MRTQDYGVNGAPKWAYVRRDTMRRISAVPLFGRYATVGWVTTANIGSGTMTDGRPTYAEEITRVFRQVVGVVLVSWRRILRAGLVSGALALLGAEIAACLVTGSFPPPTAAHLAAVALALAIGYSVAATMLFVLLLRGGVRFIRYLEGDVTVGAEVASAFARREAREARDLGASVRRILRGGEKRSQTAPRPTLPARSRPIRRPRPVVAPGGVAGTPAVAVVGLDVARIALPRDFQPDVRRDPDDAILRTPAAMMQSLPVLASRLPRIEWTYDDQSAPRPRPVASTPAPAPATAATPTAPVSPVTSPAPVSETVAAPVPLSPSPAPAVANGRLPSSRLNSARSRDVGVDSPEPETPGGTPDAPGLIPRGWRRPDRPDRPDAATRPLPAITRPLPTPSGARSGSLWERVSQALVGETAPATAPGTHVETEAEVAEDGRPATPPAHDGVTPEDAWLNG